MRRVVWFSAALTLLTATTLLSARMIGSASADPSQFAILFTNADGSPCEQPCLLGVQPGRMSFSDATSMLEKHPVTRNLKHDNSNAGPAVYVYFSGQTMTTRIDSTLNWIDVMYHDPFNPALPPGPD